VTSFDDLAGKPCTRNGQSGSISIAYSSEGIVTLRCVLLTAPTELDIVFLIDTSEDMAGALSNLRSSLGTIISAILAINPNSQFAIASFEDFPINPYGSTGDMPYRLYVSLTGNYVALMSAAQALTVHNGGDLKESGNEALYQISTGEGHSFPGGIIPPSPIGFRPAARKLVVVMTNALFHDDYYGFPWHSKFEALESLKSREIKVVGINSGGSEVRAALEQYAYATGAIIPVTLFGGNMCLTGIGGLGLPPDSNNNCPVVYDISSDGTGLGSGIVQAITLLGTNP
jgi:hypothetical protein